MTENIVGNDRSTRTQRPLEWMRFDPVKYSLLCDGLTFAQVGALTKAMLHLWQRGPMTEADLQRIAKGEFPGIVDLFTPHGDGLSLDMIEEARAYGAGMQSRASAAGKASAVQRSLNKRSTRVKRTLNERSTSAEQSLNGSSTDVLSMSMSLSPSLSESGGNSRARTPRPDPATDIPEALRTPEFIAAWADREQSLREARKRVTPTARKAQLDQCLEWGHDRALAAVKHSISYQGLFEPNGRAAHDKPKGPMTYAEARAKLEAIRAANGIAPGGYLPTNLIPAEVREAMQRPMSV